MSRWEYGQAYIRHPIAGHRVEFEDGSALQEHDIFDPLPAFMREADLVFVDPPWNMGNLTSFYTKAGQNKRGESFSDFYRRLFDCIQTISPKTCYIEVGKDFLAEFVMEMKKIFRSVTFYNSKYYRNANNVCYVIRGGRKRRALPLDGMDEADIISWVCSNEDYDCIGDPCMGQGLVGMSAYLNGARFVGTDLNHRRLAVLVEKLHNKGLAYTKQEIA